MILIAYFTLGAVLVGWLIRRLIEQRTLRGNREMANYINRRYPQETESEY